MYSFPIPTVAFSNTSNVSYTTFVTFSAVALLVLVVSASIFSYSWYQKEKPTLASTTSATASKEGKVPVSSLEKT